MYRHVICIVILACVLGFGTMAQAQLFVPPIDNPSFEVPDLGPGGTGQWADYAEEWVISNQGDCYLEDGTCLHEDRDFTLYIIGWSVAAALLLFGFVIVILSCYCVRFHVSVVINGSY
jgi:hypothetical protein